MGGGRTKNFYWASRELQNEFGLLVWHGLYNFFFRSFRSYLDILLLIFVMSQNLRLVSILKKAYALHTYMEGCIEYFLFFIMITFTYGYTKY